MKTGLRGPTDNRSAFGELSLEGPDCAMTATLVRALISGMAGC